MVEDYAQPVMETIEASSNSRDQLANIVDQAEEAITRIDQDVGELLTQRNRLVHLHANYVSIYQALHQEELRTRTEVRDIGALPPQAENSEAVRKEVIDMAEQLYRLRGRVTEQEVVDQVKRRFPSLPWKNPNAVVATILTRTGRWKKGYDGYLMSTEEDAPPF